MFCVQEQMLIAKFLSVIRVDKDSRVWNKAQCLLPNRHRRFGVFCCHLRILDTQEHFSFFFLEKLCDQILVVIGSS